MEVINISEKIYEKKPKYIGKYSTLYEEDGMLYKIFNINDSEILKRKQEKVEFLNSLDLNLKPVDIIKIDGVFKGYTEKDLNLLPLDCFKGNTKYKLEVLKRIKKELDRLSNMGICFDQISHNNILVSENSVNFSSIDNSKIGNLDFDFKSNRSMIYLTKFNADEYFINYMFNLFTISYLKNICEGSCLDYIRKYDLPFTINNKENRQITDHMLYLDDKEKIKPFIEKTKRYHLF